MDTNIIQYVILRCMSETEFNGVHQLKLKKFSGSWGNKPAPKDELQKSPGPSKNDPVWGSANEMDFFLLWVTNSFKEKGWNGGGGEEEKKKKNDLASLLQTWSQFHSRNVGVKKFIMRDSEQLDTGFPKDYHGPRPWSSNIHIIRSRNWAELF